MSRIAKTRLFLDKMYLAAVVLIYRSLNFLLRIIKPILFKEKEIPHDIKNIIIFRNGNIGDIVCAIPSISRVKRNFPKAKITLLSSPGGRTMPGAKEIFVDKSLLDEIIVYYQENIRKLKGKIEIVKKLKEQKIDLFIELPQDSAGFLALLRDMIFAKLIKAKYAFGFQIGTLALFKKTQSKYLKREYETRRLLKIIENSGSDIRDIDVSTFSINREDKRVAKNFLASLKNEKFVIINPNSKTQAKIWPLDRFADVGKRLIENHKVMILITGGDKDADRASKLKDMIGYNTVNIAGKFSLTQTMEIIKHCQLVVSNDTGIIHIAAFFNIPIIGVYSSRQMRGRWHPDGVNCAIFRKEPVCHTCFKDYCEHITCLKMIGADEVYMAAAKILGGKLH